MANPHPTSRIVLLSGDICFVDESDLATLARWRWSIHGGYAARRYMSGGRSVRVFMHRALMAVPSGMEVDHINRDRLDNRRGNLRIVQGWMNSQNCQRGRSGVRGVVFHPPTGKWNARICVGGRTISLGVFPTIEEAASARLLAEDTLGRKGDPIDIKKVAVAIRGRSNNRYGVIGVSFNHSRNKWESWVTIGGVKRHLGMFMTMEEAKSAREAAGGLTDGLAVLREEKP